HPSSTSAAWRHCPFPAGAERIGDEDITANNTSTPSPPVIAGPITCARARQLNHQVSSLLSSCSSYLDSGDPCTLVLLRNQGEDREGKGLARVGFGLHKSIDL